MYGRSFLAKSGMVDFAKVELFPSSSFEDVEDIVASRFKVRGCVVRLRYKHLAFETQIRRSKQVTHRHEPENEE